MVKDSPSISIPDTAGMIRTLLHWYQANRRDLPWRVESTPYHVWLSEVMLQQTRVETALPYYRRFLSHYPRLEDLAQADEEEVLALWSGLGYYSRARNLRLAAQIVCEKYAGRFPSSYQQALNLPGIGRYTAGAILSIAYRQPVPILDGNIRRVMARLLARNETSDRLDRILWPILTDLVQQPEATQAISEFNQSLMELGALVCLPRSPHCRECPLRGMCRAFLLDLQDQIPRPKTRRAVQELNFTVAVIQEGDRWLFCQGHGDRLLEGFWELPRIQGLPTDSSGAAFLESHGLPIRVVQSFAPIRHQITFRKLQFYPLRGVLVEETPQGNWRWATLDEPDLPVASYTRKILKQVEDPYGKETLRYNSSDESG